MSKSTKQYYLICPYCFMWSDDVVYRKTTRRGIQIGLCDRCKRTYMVRSSSSLQPKQIFYFVGDKEKRAIQGCKPHKKEKEAPNGSSEFSG